MKSLTQYLAILILLLALGACSDNSTSSEPPGQGNSDKLTQQQLDIIGFFKELTIGTEVGNASDVTRRWEQDVRLFVGGEPTDELITELNESISDINQLVEGSNLSMSVTEDSSSSNAYLFFGTASDYAKLEPENAQFVSNESHANFFLRENSSTNDLARSSSFVDPFNTRNSTESRHLVRRVVTQSLGFTKLPKMDVKSLLGNGANQTTELLKVDEWLIELLYHPQMSSGLNESQADKVLREIIDDVVPR